MASNGNLPSKDLKTIPFAVPVRDHSSMAAYTPKAHRSMIQSLTHLNAAFRREFKRDLKINSAYRPLSVQRAFYSNRGRAGWPATASVPGTSVHGWGLALDIGGLGGFGSKEYKWLEKNAGRYGFWQPAQYKANGRWPEYWHWEFRLAKSRYRRKKIAYTRTLDNATVEAVGRATKRIKITHAMNWKKVQRKVNQIMKGRKNWTPLKVDGSPGPLTWEGLRRSLRVTNRVHKPGKKATRRRIVYCWQKALNAGKKNRWSQRHAGFTYDKG